MLIELEFRGSTFSSADCLTLDLEFHHLGYPLKAAIVYNTLVTDSGDTIHISDLEYTPERCPTESQALQSIAPTCDDIGRSCYYGESSCCDKTYASTACECTAMPGENSLGQYICLPAPLCSCEGEGPGGPGGPSTTITNPLQDAKDNKAKWESSLGGVNSYIYTFQRRCFCSEEYVRPRRVTVLDNVVQQHVSFADSNGFGLLPESITTESIEYVFDMLIDGIAAGEWDSVEVIYDPTYGYPTSVNIDKDFQMADEEISISISDVVFLPSVDPCPVIEPISAAGEGCQNEGLNCYWEAGCCEESRAVSTKCVCRDSLWTCF